MIVNGHSVQFDYKRRGYKSIDEVPYWRIYVIRREKVKTRLQDGRVYKCTRNVIVYRYRFNFPIDEVRIAAKNLDKGEMIVAYARKRMTNYKI